MTGYQAKIITELTEELTTSKQMRLMSELIATMAAGGNATAKQAWTKRHIKLFEEEDDVELQKQEA